MDPFLQLIKRLTGHGVRFRLIDLDALITAKKAAGRPKDQLAVMHLDAILRLQETDDAA